jgi:hypothetical protein
MTKSDRFKPPQAVADAAKRGLSLRKEFGRGGTEIGVARASTLSNRKSVGFDTLKRMWSYFSRHKVDKKGSGYNDKDNPSPGKIAWELWGGDAGRDWVEGIRKRAIKAGVW